MVRANLLRLGIVTVALLLLWRVIFVNAVVYDANGIPRVAPQGPGAAPMSEAAELAALRQVLAANPAEFTALLMLGRELETSNTSAAARAYVAALDIAPFERDALATVATFLLRQDEPGGVAILGRLLENHAASREAGFVTLARLLGTERHRPAVLTALSQHPEWEAAFLLHACAAGTDPTVLAPLLVARRRAGKAVSAEAACAIERLRGQSRWDQAYQLWLNLLPRQRLANVGHVFNGGFEESLDPLGFDWRLARGAERETGHTAEIRAAQGATGRSALRVAYNGRRQSGVPAAQFLALPPGRYELGGVARCESLKSLRGVQWTVRCMQEGRPGPVIGQSERFLGSGDWRPFAAEVIVPAGCPGQVLQLEPALDEGPLVFISGTAWFDELRLRRR